MDPIQTSSENRSSRKWVRRTAFLAQKRRPESGMRIITTGHSLTHSAQVPPRTRICRSQASDPRAPHPSTEVEQKRRSAQIHSGDSLGARRWRSCWTRWKETPSKSATSRRLSFRGGEDSVSTASAVNEVDLVSAASAPARAR
jgi:hypothetical protein